MNEAVIGNRPQSNLKLANTAIRSISATQNLHEISRDETTALFSRAVVFDILLVQETFQRRGEMT